MFLKYLFWGLVDDGEDAHVISTFKEIGTGQALQAEEYRSNKIWKRD